MEADYFEGTTFNVVVQWTGQLCFIAVDGQLPLPECIPIVLSSLVVTMLLCVYVMWSQSRIILGVLLCIYVPERIITLVFSGIYSHPKAYFSGMSENPPDVMHSIHKDS